MKPGLYRVTNEIITGLYKLELNELIFVTKSFKESAKDFFFRNSQTTNFIRLKDLSKLKLQTFYHVEKTSLKLEKT
jgi:hypothetical protein